MSFGGGLAQIRATPALRPGTTGLVLPPGSLIGADAPMQAQRINAHPLPALSLRGERRGRGARWFAVRLWGKFFGKGFLLQLNSRLIATAGKEKRLCGK